MITAYDVEQDISRGHRAGLETAFRALIGYPGEETIQGADTADSLLRLLYRVAFALLNDVNVIPNTTMELLRGAMRRGAIHQHTYAEASHVVLDDLDYWRAVFYRQVDGADV